ncbi:hypothetical protein V5O48_009575 [Marasmius crinis-equi]|uniref:GmrSD restriction endonucleases N-terminal domain-containing protein n=1 Tax=Marasmius crinis-equi TaxID=585013 RepID=A0ABR3FAP0_9AGAR
MASDISMQDRISGDAESELTDIESSDNELDGSHPSPALKKPSSTSRLTKLPLPKSRLCIYTTESICKWLRNDAIDLQEAEHEKDITWTNEKQSNFLDSIINNYYIPPIVLCVEHDPSTGKVSKMICIDGRQRLNSLWRFMNGDLYHKDPRSGSKIWYDTIKVEGRKGMSKPDRTEFESQQILCIEYDDLTEEQQREVCVRARQRLRSDSTRSPTPNHSHLRRRCHAASNAGNLDGSNDIVTERETPKTPVASTSQAFHTSPPPVASLGCPQSQVSEAAGHSSGAASDSSEEVYQSAEEGSTGTVAMQDESTMNSADKSGIDLSVHEDPADAMQFEHGDPEVKGFSCGNTEISSFLSDVKDILNSFSGETGDEDSVITLRQKIDELEGLALEALIRARRLQNELEVKRTDSLEVALLTRWEAFCESKLGGV